MCGGLVQPTSVCCTKQVVVALLTALLSWQEKYSSVVTGSRKQFDEDCVRACPEAGTAQCEVHTSGHGVAAAGLWVRW